MADLEEIDDLDRGPTPEELEAIEKEMGTFSDPEWENDGTVDLDYPGHEYDYEEE